MALQGRFAGVQDPGSAATPSSDSITVRFVHFTQDAEPHPRSGDHVPERQIAI
jgi:hypothetical protein